MEEDFGVTLILIALIFFGYCAGSAVTQVETRRCIEQNMNITICSKIHGWFFYYPPEEKKK